MLKSKDTVFLFCESQIYSVVIEIYCNSTYGYNS